MICILLAGALVCWLVARWSTLLAKWLALLAVVADFILIAGLWMKHTAASDVGILAVLFSLPHPQWLRKQYWS